MLEPLTKPTEENSQDLRQRFCEHCATPFTVTNSTFRLKSKHKRKKRKFKSTDKGNNTQEKQWEHPKGSNYLEILCKYCGWKTRHVGTTGKKRKSRDIEGSWTPDNGTPPQTPCSRKTTPKLSEKPECSPMTPYSGKRRSRSKPKSTLKALLDREKEASKNNASSPSLLNFLATV